jgi:hypothetical protein
MGIRGATSAEANGEDFRIAPVGPEFKFRENCSGFISQEREIFMVNMLIRQTETEIARMDQHQDFEDSMFVDQIQKLLELENQYRMTQSQYEAALFRQRKGMEAAIKRRSDLSEALRKKRLSLDAIAYQIDLNEELTESFLKFDKFLSQYDEVIPREQLYQNPKFIVDEIIHKENQNRLLIEWFTELSGEKDRNIRDISEKVEHTTIETSKLNEIIDSLKVDDLIDMRTGPVSRDTEIADRELERLSQIVSKYYSNCFRKSADISAIMMLERLENELESLYKIADRLNPQYLAEKQTLRDRSRREDQRRAKQEFVAKEAQRKIKAALERSQRPVKKHYGRPVIARSRFCGFEKEASGGVAKGDEVQEAMLFGSIEK